MRPAQTPRLLLAAALVGLLGGAVLPPPRAHGYTAPCQYLLTPQDNPVTTLDTATGLTWESQPPATAVTWSAAHARCLGLSGSWRLPSIWELQTIVDEGRKDPAIDPAAFPGTQKLLYWSATAYGPQAGNHMGVYFDKGNAGTYADDKVAYSRCVSP
jgi:hypothetical protein